MKCNNCGANFQSADLECPYCGSRNVVGEEWQQERNWAKKLYEDTLRKFREEGVVYVLNSILNKAIKILGIVILVGFLLYLIPMIFSEVAFKINKSIQLEQVVAKMQEYHENGEYKALEQIMDEYDMFGKEYYVYSQSAILYRNYQDYMIHKMTFLDLSQEEKIEDDYHLEYILKDSMDVYLVNCGIYDDLREENRMQYEVYKQEIENCWKKLLALTDEEIQYMVEEEYLYSDEWDRYVANIKERKAWQ